MKKLIFLSFPLLFTSLSTLASIGTIECKEIAREVITPNRHCPRKCGGHANNYGFQGYTATLTREEINEGWRLTETRGTYCKVGGRIGGHAACRFVLLTNGEILESKTAMYFEWKSWSSPVYVGMRAEICKTI